MQVTCGNCAGVGKTIIWRHRGIDENGFGVAQKEETICAACDGKGYTEYAVFSIEEAEAILKHCGLNTES